jgi:hypothetical protein
MAETREHVVAATHFVLGPSNFVVLRLPPNWDLRLGRHPMDIDYTIAYDGVRWAQEGRASALLVDAKARRAIELSIQTARNSIPPPKLLESEAGTASLGGHTASFVIGTQDLGFFGTKRYTTLRISYRCEETKRLIDMRFMHRGDRATLLGLIKPLERCRCH